MLSFSSVLRIGALAASPLAKHGIAEVDCPSEQQRRGTVINEAQCTEFSP
jgi:hypothetical protein